MSKETYDETGVKIDADGWLGDPITNDIAKAVSQYYPALQFDPNNVKASFEKALDAETDPKAKTLLQLIYGLYIARKQHNQELNILFKRVHDIGQFVAALYERGRLLELALTNVEEIEKFKEEYEPMLRRLTKYLDDNASRVATGDEQLK